MDTTELEPSKLARNICIKFAQDALQDLPVIILGSGASAAHGFPTMSDLGKTINDSELSSDFNDADKRNWDELLEALARKDIESAIGDSRLTDTVKKAVIRLVWENILKADQALFERLVRDGRRLPLSTLFVYLFNSTHRSVSVVTTNYDRIAEYAADQSGFFADVGFDPGYIRKRSSITQTTNACRGNSARSVNVWKVHGSIDWFAEESGETLCLPSANSIPNGLSPKIITPGADKYQEAYNEPMRSIIIGADGVLTGAKSYLCVGYGFNDKHIQPKLLEQWKTGLAKLVVLTCTATPALNNIISAQDPGQYLILEHHEDGTRMRSKEYPEGVVLPDDQFWTLEGFVTIAKQ